MINDHIYLNAETAAQFGGICDAVLGTAMFVPVSKKAQEYVLNPELEDNTLGVVPADIVHASTIPLRACVIHNSDIGMSCLFEPFEWYEDGPLRFHHSRCTVVLNNGIIYHMTVTAFPGDDTLDYPWPVQYREKNGRFRTIYVTNMNDADAYVIDRFEMMLRVWYGIQIMLLNPYVKDVFRTVDKKETHFNPNGKKRKYRVCYVRHHYLNPEAQIGLGTTADGGKMRHTLAWYVCGHWRHYSDGKVIFIQPYWKGPLRETKACEPRERIVV